MNTKTTETEPHIDSLDVYLDFACPWSYLGLHRIAGVQKNATLPINYRAFQLNPTLPTEGIPRETYRVNKFGTLSESQRRDSIVTQAASAEGISINFDNILRTPNTRLAHRALKFTLEQGLGVAFALAVYNAYFTEALDIGEPKVLLNIAASLDMQLTIEQLENNMSPQDQAIDADVNAARSVHLTGVPFVIANIADDTHVVNLPNAVKLIQHSAK